MLFQLSPTASKKSGGGSDDGAEDDDDEEDDEKLSTSCSSDIDPERLKAFNVCRFLLSNCTSRLNCPYQ